MKKILLSVLIFLSFQVSAQLAGPCAHKQREIQNQLDYARLNQNHYQIAGLKAAINNLRLHCTEASIAKDKEIEIAEKQRKVAQREENLAEAEREGRPDKIVKAENRLSEARAELEGAKIKFE